MHSHKPHREILHDNSLHEAYIVCSTFMGKDNIGLHQLFTNNLHVIYDRLVDIDAEATKLPRGLLQNYLGSQEGSMKWPYRQRSWTRTTSSKVQMHFWKFSIAFSEIKSELDTFVPFVGNNIRTCTRQYFSYAMSEIEVCGRVLYPSSEIS